MVGGDGRVSGCRGNRIDCDDSFGFVGGGGGGGSWLAVAAGEEDQVGCDVRIDILYSMREEPRFYPCRSTTFV